jgi:hypothetical protein
LEKLALAVKVFGAQNLSELRIKSVILEESFFELKIFQKQK